MHAILILLSTFYLQHIYKLLRPLAHAIKHQCWLPFWMGQDNLYIFVLQMIMERKFQPVIVFSFSRRECEQYATSMAKLDFNTDEEKEIVEDIFKKAIEVLSEEDRSLPAIDLILPLLKRGIGVHHSGLLPILKEVIELLFQEGLCKALFATETVCFSLFL